MSFGVRELLLHPFSQDYSMFVSIQSYDNDSSSFAGWTGEIGRWEGFKFIKAKGGSIWVRTKPRFMLPLKVRPIYPKREIKFWRDLAKTSG